MLKGIGFIAGVIFAWWALIKLINFIIKYLEKKEKKEQELIKQEEEIVSELRNLIKWQQDGDVCFCTLSLENAPFKLLKPEAFKYIYLKGKSYKNGELVEKGHPLLNIEGTNLFRYSFYQTIHAPVTGIVTYEIKTTNEYYDEIFVGSRFILINTSSQAIDDFRAEQERQLEENTRKALEREKKEIAEKIKEKHRKRELEKIVRQELMDSGELYGDEAKRPPIPREVVDAVYRRDGGRCVYCGSTENIHLDHIIPFSCGGATNVENLQLLCQKCNLSKSNKIG